MWFQITAYILLIQKIISKEKCVLSFGVIRKVARVIIKLPPSIVELPLLAVMVSGEALLYITWGRKCMYYGIKLDLLLVYVNYKVPLSRVEL